ncbi:MAG TPA: heterodisulfide reductase-related iron-sulfur binding cluster, partial [Thermodesulfobacteriota bacterium]|nr:heterodisulfide reductase-related iron-sulfur binding cluster [Thermodesulfobacteriota bacterium]
SILEYKSPLGFLSAGIFFGSDFSWWLLPEYVGLAKGWPGTNKINFSPVISATLKQVLGNSKIFSGDLLGGLMHLFIMWGFFVLFLGTVLSAFNDYIFYFLKGPIYLYYSLTLDVFGLIFIIGLIMSLIRRYIIKTGKMNNLFEDPLVLILLLAIGITGFLIEGYRLVAKPEAWLAWEPVGAFLAGFLRGDALQWHVIIWWVHSALSLMFIGYLPFSKLFHVIASPLNVIVETLPPEVVTLEEREKLTQEFSRRHLIAFDACTRCNRCETRCPSNLSGETLSPRAMNQKMKAYAKKKYSISRLISEWLKKPTPEVPKTEVLQGEEAWMCTTCRACVEECPISINNLDIIREIRRAKVEEGTQVPTMVGNTLEAIFKYGNPYQGAKNKRQEWAKELEIKDLSKGQEAAVLYYVGCAFSYDNRLQEIARSAARVFTKAGLDFGILGNKESCCGDMAKRIGEEGLLEELIMKNYETFEEGGVKEVVTTCPHGLKMLRDEYPLYRKKLEIQTEGEIKVQHYTEMLAKLLTEKRLTFTQALKKRVTYHDPCYLGRHCGVYDEPRMVIQAIPGVTFVEMKRNRRNSFCCGGGGGRVWMEEFEAREKISEVRIRDAAEVGAELLITACPFCMSMLEDAVKTAGYENKMEVKDLAEVLVNLV